MENQTAEVVRVVKQEQSLTIRQVTDRVNLVHEVLKKVMKKGTHFGKVPGCGDKLVLLKPGADVLAMTFRLVPQFKVERSDLADGHREFDVTCSMFTPDGELLGQGVGSASTMEKKYRYRRDAKGQKIENEDIADVYNTVLKIAKKRAHIDATLTVTGAADLFTQDLIEEDDAAEKKPPVSMPVEKQTYPVAPEEKPPAGEVKTVTGKIEATSMKTSAPDAEKPWVKHGFKVGGKWYATFDQTLGTSYFKGDVVDIEYETDANGYHNIKSMGGKDA